MNSSRLLVGVLFLGFATECHLRADTDPLVNLQLTGVGGNAVGGVYVSPYSAAVAEWGQTVRVFCADYQHHVYLGETWTARVSAINAIDLANAQYPGQLSNYQAAAVLFGRSNALQPGQSDYRYWQAVYNYAAWWLFLPSLWNTIRNLNVPGFPGPAYDFDGDVRQARDAALAAGPHADTSGWVVLTYDSNAWLRNGQSAPIPVQEFLTQVPEPSSISLLLGAAGLALYFLRRRVSSAR